MILLTLCLVIALCSATEEQSWSSRSCFSQENMYSRESNKELTEEEMFRRGHMKEFGAHRPPDFFADEIPFMPSPEDFYMNYVVKHKPVVIKGATKHWPAYKLWTDEYLREKYGNETVKMETKDDDKYNIPPSQKFSKFLDEYQNEKSKLYLVDEVLPRMRDEIILPLCLRCEEIDRYFFVSYIWLSAGNTMSTVHIDTDENLLCVIKGHKRSIMVSPIYSKYLYADESRVKGVCDVNTSAVDLEKFPDVMKIKYWVANANEGDCIYIPQMWWHQVYSRKERQLAVALWWKSKPFWKNVQNNEKKGVTRKFTAEEMKNRRPYSYSDTLKDYEEWVLDVAPDVPRIKCKEQQVLMSKYHWETDYGDEPEVTLGDGGDVEEEAEEEEIDINKVKEKVAEKRQQGKSSCQYDRSIKNSPCYYKPCFEDEAELKCLKYVLDYCSHYDDRGCVVNKPQLLNKKDDEDMKELEKMPKRFKV